MVPSSVPSSAEPVADPDSSRSSIAALEHAIEHATHLLPAQGPISVFIHHNTLHAFEHLPFDEGVQQGARLYGCQPYMTEDQFHARLAAGRITVADLRAVLSDELGASAADPVAPGCTRFDLRLSMLEQPVRVAPSAELRWYVAETDALTRLPASVSPEARDRLLRETRHWALRDFAATRAVKSADHTKQDGSPSRGNIEGLIEKFGADRIEHWSDATWEAFALQSLWRLCREGVHGVKPPAPEELPYARPRDLLLAATGEDCDYYVNELLIRFCAAFLDQGVSHWMLPDRKWGFLASFSEVYGQRALFDELWMRHLPEALARIERLHLSPLESIAESLAELGIEEHERDAFVTATLLALRGWAGMIHQVEIRGERAVHPIPAGSLVEYLAVRLILERLALAWVAEQQMGFTGPLSDLRRAAKHATPPREKIGVDQRAFRVFQIAQRLGWAPSDLSRWTKDDWRTLVAEIESFGPLERRRLFQAAYERHYRVQLLDAISLHTPTVPDRTKTPRFQVICCLDEREESFRRHIEEIAPQAVTFGAAGFFAVPMYYRGAGEANFVPLCPVVVTPKHWVEEDVVYTQEMEHDRRARARRAMGLASHQLHLRSRGLAAGALLTASMGSLASIPLIARVLFPRLTAKIRRAAGRLVQPPEQTHLDIERCEPNPGHEGGHIGFTVAEMTDMVERQFRDMGLISDFARLVIFLGHGSHSLNNPHYSAYNCGACGGGAGGPNARAIAAMANDPRVRFHLAERGLRIPDDTIVIGGDHNTGDDSVVYFDLDKLPRSHQQEFAETQRIIEEACDRNAHERCRRFVSAPLDLTFEQARRHVEERSEDLAQVRPECGHATNAVCFVGRRSRTRGLYLDRRTFLTSYDPTQDDEEYTILTRVLAAAVPVCAGINLEYYFSYVDPIGFGCSTKLPHNIASLLGVMDGAASDLRTGLPWQMVEIHEPIRQVFVIETTPAAILQIMDRNPGIGRTLRNGWGQLATLSPTSNEIHFFERGEFRPYVPTTSELPRVASSTDWYRGWRDHLGFAAIQSEPAKSDKAQN